MTKHVILTAAVFCFLISGCSNSSFKGSTGGIRKSKCPQGDCGSPATNLPPGLEQPLPSPAPIVPKSCKKAELKIIGPGSSCPDGHAIYGIDDPSSKQNAGAMACCPLPASDILVGEPQTRAGGTCTTNEVMVGNSAPSRSNISAICRSINTSRYKLVPAEVCYFGDGSTGRGSAVKCETKGAIPSAFDAISGNQSVMGIDGCLNFPWGSLSVAQRDGSSCSDQSAMQLLLLDGTTVKMFE
jgi:hypothetical protein